MQPDLALADRFLKALAPDEGPEPCFSFQTFSDDKLCDDATHRKLTRVFHGPLTRLGSSLTALNRAGAGVYATINRTDLRGRRYCNVKSVRANFVDLDGAPLEGLTKIKIVPNIIVQSSPGRYHAYWLTRTCSLSRFASLQRQLAALCGGDPKVHDLPRVMRLPGFYHLKHDEPFLVECEFIHGDI